ncbi:MAG: hypothetical protein UY92_C0006G0083 [Candidatus Magasanikbacteria bacterium GW2011_GWA2_56_11]|uniref:Methicillin resistance protein n=1 Tax=Candidatus Magasanikbacteria bacterium GW2011_GWA2_56_11 TaxID=1619044 RepID=A0A0G2AMH6_9BACT|nr:MAG: hypothetical protein UY92_C0006G0083 [Candidatus Magasanikbacteria bacterium GW2011_GWA2_56_11]
MELEVREIKDRSVWEAFVRQRAHTLFVQSWSYGEFYRSLGENFWVYGVYSGEDLLGGSLVVSVHARRGSFLYLPYGPLLAGDAGNPESAAIFRALFDYLADWARFHSYSFIRVSPFFDDTPALRSVFGKLGFHNAPMHILAEHTWLLNLEPAEEDLLARMDKTHRQLIRRCENEGVRAVMETGAGAVGDFNRLHDQTARRHNFHRFSDGYVLKEFGAFAPQNEALVIHGYLPDGSLDASGVFMYYGSMAAYRHGASLMANKRLPSSYLVQWEAIREAKRRGFKWYNFWGVAPDAAPKSHPFKGITHFKKGFGGSGKDLLPCQDLPVSWRYWINWTVEKVRRVKRGFA